jgi:hyperosmotically inducible protein
MASHHEIIDFIENIRAEIPGHLHGFYEEAVDRALEQQHKRGKEFARQIIETNPMIRSEWNHKNEEEGFLAIFVLVIGFLGGAALMYLFDPDRGDQRRASLLGQVNHAEQSVKQAAEHAEESVKHAAEQVRDEASKAVGHASDSVKSAVDQAEQVVKDTSTQANKAASSATASASSAASQASAAVSDATLTARVRAEIARAVHSPGAIEVTINQGVVTLKGQVPSTEAKGLVEKVQAVAGVKSVESRLEINDAPAASGD